MRYDWTQHGLPPTSWRGRIASPLTMLLIHRAKDRRTTTFGELAAELAPHHGTRLGRATLFASAANAIGLALDAMGRQWGESIPPLHALLVRDSDQLPPSGMAGVMDHDVRLRAVEAVFDYGDRWDHVAEALRSRA